AEIFVKNGYQVRLYDDFKDSLNIALAKISWSLQQAGKENLLANLEGIQDFSKFKGADIIIETQGKDMDERRHAFSKLTEFMEPECVIAAFCAVVPLKTLIENTELPKDRTVGLHFVRPVRVNPLVELVRLDHTGDGFMDAVMSILRKIGKTPILVKDNPGQIVERLTRPFLLSALKLLGDGKGSPHEIDTAFKEVGGQLPYGPFEMADFIGLDVDYKAAQDIYEFLGKPERLTPSAVELRLVQYGQVGRKATIGFYIYEDGRIVGENPILPNFIKYLGLRKAPKEEIFAELLRPMIEEAKLLAAEIMASEYDIETAVKLAMGWPKGLFAYSRDLEHLFVKKRVSEFDKLDTF
ncbi:MAG: 3-hydroxyacyl-CoA dehydrogenase family protein, partial [Elusimicrobia bacterium]|nr:3-hydroxyacyl-CoA dehydrogenase family protein [Elusimicrobiota bacterium]